MFVKLLPLIERAAGYGYSHATIHQLLARTAWQLVLTLQERSLSRTSAPAGAGLRARGRTMRATTMNTIPENDPAFWSALEAALALDDGAAALTHLAAGNPVYLSLKSRHKYRDLGYRFSRNCLKPLCCSMKGEPQGACITFASADLLL